MHSILLVVDKPTSTNTYEQAKWKKFSYWLESKSSTSLKSSMLAENVFLLQAQNGLGFFSQLVTQAEENELHYRVLFFENEPSWITS